MNKVQLVVVFYEGESGITLKTTEKGYFTFSPLYFQDKMGILKANFTIAKIMPI